MTVVAISTTTDDVGEYVVALRAAGATPRLTRFDLETLDDQLADAGGVLLSGGGDVDPRYYGTVSDLATDIDIRRDEFEIALVRRARERGIPTLCICRGLQVANVAFGGTLVVDIASLYGRDVAAQHRVEVDGRSIRGLIAGHDVEVERGSLLATIAGRTSLVTGSRHHQSLATVSPDLHVVAATRDGIVEAAEACFETPFWLGVQWHPESTVSLDDGVSRAIFNAFVEAAGHLHAGQRRSVMSEAQAACAPGCGR